MNARMDARSLARHVALDASGEQMLTEASRTGMLSARGIHRVLRVARTIADLDDSTHVRVRDLGIALGLRVEAHGANTRAA